METKTRFILRHQSGLYISWSPDSFPHTKRLSQARRFYSIEEIVDFMQHSFYRPDKPDEYEVEEIEIMYTLKEDKQDVQQERDDQQNCGSSRGV